MVNYFGQQLSLSFGRKKKRAHGKDQLEGIAIRWEDRQQEQAAKERHWGLEGVCLRRAKAQRQKGGLKNGSDEGSKDQGIGKRFTVYQIYCSL